MKSKASANPTALAATHQKQQPDKMAQCYHRKNWCCKDLGCKSWDSKCILRKIPLSEVALSTFLTQVIILAQRLLCKPFLTSSFVTVQCWVAGKSPVSVERWDHAANCQLPNRGGLELDCCQGYFATKLEICLPHSQPFVAVGFFYFSSQSCRQTHLGRHSEPSHGHREGQLLISTHSCILESFLHSSLYDYFLHHRKPCFAKMNSTSEEPHLLSLTCVHGNHVTDNKATHTPLSHLSLQAFCLANGNLTCIN